METFFKLLVLVLSWKSILGATPSEPINVIVLTYHRSGSSFVGELLSLPSNAAYFFEPLHYVRFKLASTAPKDYRRFLAKLMACDYDTLDVLRKAKVWTLRKFGTVSSTFHESTYNSTELQQMCLNTTLRIVKTIRLRMKDAAKLVATMPNLTILHLVRDPRARFNSAQARGGSWSDTEKSLDVICGEMAKDLRMAQTIPRANYHLLKYEDLASNITNVTANVYLTLYGTGVGPEVLQYIKMHTDPEPQSKRVGDYYSTYRSMNFTWDHWKQDLAPEVIKKVEENPTCNEVLKKLGYPVSSTD